MNEGIYMQDLTKHEKFIKFEPRQSYSIPANAKHQIVHDENMNDIGIAFSNNGRNDFRQFKQAVTYWFAQPYAYIVSEPMGGKSQDLSELV